MKDKFGEFQICRGFEGTGKCWWCGGDFPDKRYRRFCCEGCGDKYRETYYWAWAVPAAIERAEHKCEDCGEGYSEVHHIVPLGNEPRHFNIKNEPGNLIVLCRACHGKRHRSKNSRELRVEKGQLVLGLLE